MQRKCFHCKTEFMTLYMNRHQSFFSSFKHAFRGLKLVAVHERNFRIQLFVGAVIFVFMTILPLAHWERILLVLLISAVLVLEILNTSIERISDLLKPRLHSVVKDVKDMTAGAVLIMAITSVVVAVMIFRTYVVDLFTSNFPGL